MMQRPLRKACCKAMGLLGSCGPQPQGVGSERENPSEAAGFWFKSPSPAPQEFIYPQIKSFQKCIPVLGMQKFPGPSTSGKSPMGASFNTQPQLKWRRPTVTPRAPRVTAHCGRPYGTPGTGVRPFQQRHLIPSSQSYL